MKKGLCFFICLIVGSASSNLLAQEKNRKKFYEVRIESLQTSIDQINNMHKQIQIDYTILPPDFYERQLVDREHRIIISSIELLEQAIALLESVNQK